MGLDPRPGDIAQARALAAKKRRDRTVFGENAAEKARTPVVQEARETVDEIIRGDVKSTTASERLRALGLSHAEKADVESYSRARSKQSLRENDFQEQAAGYLLGSNIAKLLPGGSPASDADPRWVAAEAAMLGPLGRIGRGGKSVVDKVAEKAAEKTPVPAGAEKIIEALPEAKKLRREQEKLYTAERSARVAKAAEAMKAGGEEGYRAALSELKGELPKLRFGALEDFNQESMEALLKHVQEQEGLRFFEKVGAQKALKLVVEEGRVPTRSQMKLLERAFGADTAMQIVESAGFWKQAKNHGLSLINVPRSLMASYDVSAPFRQGLVLGARHPRMFARELRPMFQALRSEGAYEDVMEQIAARPTFKKMQDAKLQLTDLEGLTTREDQFMSNLAEGIPVAGRGVRASGRAYTAFLNKFRADAFDNYLRMADEQGLDLNDPHLLRSIGSWVNHATGRGSIKYFEGAMVPLTAALFSPRLMASRLQLLNPVYYKQLHPFARKQALQGAAQTLGGISLTLYMAKLAGAHVGIDPRSTDFGKIKVGNTRVDITGGFQGYVVAGYRFAKGETKSSTTGEVRKLEGGFGNPSRWGLVASFLENKTAPVAGTAIDKMKNENFEGEPFNPRDLWKQMVPFGVSTGLEGYKEGGPAAAAAAVGLGGIGFGVQTYSAKPPKAATKDYKEALADIEQGVRTGELSPEDAAEFKRLARADYEATLRSKQLRARGLKDDKETGRGDLDRQLMIDDGVRQGDDLDTVNEFLLTAGYPPASADELEDAEMDLLELRAVAGG